MPVPSPSTLRICVLASGSSGNCIHVESAETAILIDAGLSARKTLQRMKEAGLNPDRLSAICVTHEHSDHTAGLRVLSRQLNVTLYANGETARAIRDGHALDWKLFTSGSPFQVGDITLLPFSLPHDAYDPVGFVLTSGPARIGICTDLGIPTQLVRERLRGCQILVLEANHDPSLLQSCSRPWSLKKRIMGNQGHLSNEAAADLLADVAGDELRHVFLAHLSSECNRPDLALFTIRKRLDREGFGHVRVWPTHPHQISEIADCPTGNSPCGQAPTQESQA